MRTLDRLEMSKSLKTVESPKKSQRRAEDSIFPLIRSIHASFLPGDHLHGMLFESFASWISILLFLDFHLYKLLTIHIEFIPQMFRGKSIGRRWVRLCPFSIIHLYAFIPFKSICIPRGEIISPIIIRLAIFHLII